MPQFELRKLPLSYCVLLTILLLQPQTGNSAESAPPAQSRSQADEQYRDLQRGLAQGWNTWDVNSMTTHVLLPEGLAIHIGFKHNETLFGDDFLPRVSVGSGTVFAGSHAWDGSYTNLKIGWKGHEWSVESAHDGSGLVLLVTPRDPLGKFAHRRQRSFNRRGS